MIYLESIYILFILFPIKYCEPSVICSENNKLDFANETIPVSISFDDIEDLSSVTINAKSLEECLSFCCKHQNTSKEHTCDTVVFANEKCLNLNCADTDDKICKYMTTSQVLDSSDGFMIKLKRDIGIVEAIVQTTKHTEMFQSTMDFQNDTFENNNIKNPTVFISTNMISSYIVSTTTTPKPEPLEISIKGNNIIRLPDNNVTLTANVTTPLSLEERNKLTYEWSLILKPAGDDAGQLLGMSLPTLNLTMLKIGNYTFLVKAMFLNHHGKALINVTVLPPIRKNTPPVAIVNPRNQTLYFPNDLIIHGTDSHDDDRIVDYKWTIANGPMTLLDPDEKMKLPILHWTGLIPGEYTFKLTVTDTDGADSSAIAYATILKAIDRPPKADAGQAVVLFLPDNSAVLNGSRSSDDNGIKAYMWIKKSPDNLLCDLSGSAAPVLHLSNLQVGEYVFVLTVRDEANQTDSSEVHVIVQPARNRPPTAVAESHRVVWLPLDSLILDATNSTDDKKIVSYRWFNISSPNGSNMLSDADKPIAYLKDPLVGLYKFKLVVEDEEALTSELEVVVEVKQDENKPPIANGGGNVVVNLPVDILVLNGSLSSDDRGILSYKWTRLPSSPAAGDVVNGSDEKAILQLVNIVAGEYSFNLTVTDNNKLSSFDLVKLTVQRDPKEVGLVQLILPVSIGKFLVSDFERVSEILRLAFTTPPSTVVIEAIREDISTGGTVILFYVMSVDEKSQTKMIRLANETATKLKLISIENLLNMEVIKVQSAVCQSSCSGHGVCDEFTKQCVCDTFWTSNVFKANFGGRQSNCDWSVLYIIIIMTILGLVALFFVWSLVCLCRRKFGRPKSRAKRRRYTLLDAPSETKTNGIKSSINKVTQPTNAYSNLNPESDLSSTEDDETLFPPYPPNEITRRPKNNSPHREP